MQHERPARVVQMGAEEYRKLHKFKGVVTTEQAHPERLDIQPDRKPEVLDFSTVRSFGLQSVLFLLVVFAANVHMNT